MTNVRRPKHLQLYSTRGAGVAVAAISMVSSASGPGPFGENDSGAGAGDFVGGLSIPSQSLAPEQPRPARPPAIRPTALVNLNCHPQPAPLSPASLTSPSMNVSLLNGRMRRQHQQQLPTPTCYPPTGRTPTTPSGHQPKALSPSGLNDSMPSLIVPHLYVGNQEQTNRETVNKLNIKYILSLGLLPMITANSASSHVSPTSPAPNTPNDLASQPQQPQQQPQPQILMPSRNSSKDFKIRIRTNSSTPTTTNTTTAAATTSQPGPPQLPSTAAADLSSAASLAPEQTSANGASRLRDENQGVKQVRSINCKCINISDNSDQSLSKFFDEAYAFIEEARRKKCNILVHCLAGISRSPTIAIAYLMRLRSLHWRDAYDLVKQCRPQIDPNLNFMGQLRIYNRCLREDQQMIGCKRTSNRHHSTSVVDEHRTSLKSSKTSRGQNNKTTSVLGSPGLVPNPSPVRD